jgi:hypothetical protein
MMAAAIIVAMVRIVIRTPARARQSRSGSRRQQARNHEASHHRVSPHGVQRG